jgi:threonine synthase
MNRYLVSTISGEKYPFDYLEEFAENGESLEVKIERSCPPSVREGATIWERFRDFLPFDYAPELSLGEGNTPLLESRSLAKLIGLESLFVKNETANPTWSFKDRGSYLCTLMSKEKGERFISTISTGNMGSSIAAYGARAGLSSLIFTSNNCPEAKIRSMSIHGATVFQIDAPDYGEMKKAVFELTLKAKLRLVSGNGPIRVEGYKFCAFEIYEQLQGNLPDFIAVPTSACGHIRGLFKGFIELKEANLIRRLPRMIIVQAANNSPLVTAFKRGELNPVPFTNIQTIATAITSGNPPGGDEILHKAWRYEWLAEDVTEEEILEGQRELAKAGFFVEPSAATSLMAVKKLALDGKIKPHESVMLMLTGGGLKDTCALPDLSQCVIQSNLSNIERDLSAIFYTQDESLI